MKTREGLSEQLTSLLRQRTPIAMAIFLNVGDQDLIFFSCPWPSFQSHFLTARSPHHVVFFCLCMNLNEQYRLILSYPPLMP